MNRINLCSYHEINLFCARLDDHSDASLNDLRSIRLEGFESIEKANRLIAKAEKRLGRKLYVELELRDGCVVDAAFHPSIESLVWRNNDSLGSWPEYLKRLTLVGTNLTSAARPKSGLVELSLSYCVFDDEASLQGWVPSTVRTLFVANPNYARSAKPKSDAWPVRLESLKWPKSKISIDTMPLALRELSLPEAELIEGTELPKGLKRFYAPRLHLTLYEGGDEPSLASAIRSAPLESLVVGSVSASSLNPDLKFLEVRLELLFDVPLPPKLRGLTLESPGRYVVVEGERKVLTLEGLNLVANRKPLTSLRIENYDGNTLDGVPPGLIDLRLSGGFDGSLDYLPRYVKTLSLHGSFNQNIEVLGSFERLKFLILGDRFNQPVDALPVTLKYLKLGQDFDQDLDRLPPGLQELCLHRSYDRPLKDLPESLQILRLHFYCKADRSSVGPNVRIEYFGDEIDAVHLESVI